MVYTIYILKIIEENNIMNKRRNNTIYVLSILSLMIAIMFIFGFTPIGTIKTATLSITLMGIPVSIIACIFGPWMGLMAGAIWGCISIIQAFTGMDQTALLLQSCVANGEISNARFLGGLIVMCVVARMLVGFLTGLIFDSIKTVDKRGYIATLVSCMSTALLNTILFMTSFCLFFYNTPVVSSAHLGTYPNPFVFVFAIIGINFVVEFAVNCVAGSAIVFGLQQIATKLQINAPFQHFFIKKEKAN